MMEHLLNPKQLAEILNVKLGTVYSWISRGVDIPHVKIAGTVRFREKAVMDWLTEKERNRKRRNFEI
jgi:excisionase family DNA binding protein